MTKFSSRIGLKAIARIAAITGLGFAVSGCVYDAGLGLGYASDGYDSGYGCDAYSDFDNYYDCDYGAGFNNIGYGGGWYSNYYYPGHGYFVFDNYGRRYQMHRDHQRYWGGQRYNWYRQNGRGHHYGRGHPNRDGRHGNGGNGHQYGGGHQNSDGNHGNGGHNGNGGHHNNSQAPRAGGMGVLPNRPGRPNMTPIQGNQPGAVHIAPPIRSNEGAGRGDGAGRGNRGFGGGFGRRSLENGVPAQIVRQAAPVQRAPAAAPAPQRAAPTPRQEPVRAIRAETSRERREQQ